MHILETLICNEQTNGVCPQVEHMGLDYGWDNPESLTHIISNQPLALAPNLRSFHLHPTTAVTDLISQGFVYTMGLLCSEAFREALKGYVVQLHESYRAQVVHCDRVFDFWWLHMIEEVEERINYSKSEFAVQKPDGSEEEVFFADSTALRVTCSELVDRMSGTLVTRKVDFSYRTPCYDLFCLRLTSLMYFVSDRLAAELMRRRLTGFELVPTRTVVTFEPG